DLWVTNGTVNALLATDSTLYLGGTFTQVGPATGAGVGLDATSGAVRWPFPLVTGAVYAVASDGAGGGYLGGAFTAVQHQARTNLAHLDAAGQLTAWAPVANGPVRTLLLYANTLYAGGAFTAIDATMRLYLCAFDGSTGALLSTWNPGANSYVDVL